jgi:hypothetical protein
MKLTHLSNSRIIISRLYPVAGTDNRFALSTVTAAFVNLQPASAEKTAALGGAVGKTYRLFTDFDMDLQENDQLKDEEGNIYTVRRGGVTRWRHGAMDYLEVILQQS